ncbi:hypothetical protein EBZ38_05460 [bacterium]|nr:hypothetical protein [bacterium]
MATRKKKSAYSPGTGKTQYGGYTIKPKAALRRGGTVTPKAAAAAAAAKEEKKAPLPESCHFTKTAAQKAADVLREKKIKSRVVTSGQFFCVYSVGKCRKGTLVGTGRAKTTRKKKSA